MYLIWTLPSNLYFGLYQGWHCSAVGKAALSASGIPYVSAAPLSVQLSTNDLANQWMMAQVLGPATQVEGLKVPAYFFLCLSFLWIYLSNKKWILKNKERKNKDPVQ